jgi:hypothetical protein
MDELWPVVDMMYSPILYIVDELWPVSVVDEM